MQAQVNEISGDDAAVTYSVAGYIERCISRKRKCTTCKDLLIYPENIPSLGDVFRSKRLAISHGRPWCFVFPKAILFCYLCFGNADLLAAEQQ